MATLPHGWVTGKITKTVLSYTETQVGKERAQRLALRIAQLHKLDAGILFDAESKMHMDVPEALYPLVCEELKDVDAIVKAGAWSNRMEAVGIFVYGMVKMLGGVKFVYQKVVDIAPRFANTGTMSCRDVTSSSAVLEFEMYKDLTCTKLGCDYRRGLFASVPLAFGGKGPAALTHPHCQAKGAQKEVYELKW
jgi:hypothetical protein